MRLKLVQTCGACPEQYEVYYENEHVGYLRLRHGYFYAEYRGKIVYESNPQGDGLFDYDERVRELNAACKAILAAHGRSEEEQLYTVEQR